ncbi:recombination regulator RecX [Bacillus gaemokensis]|uniref:Regulatory protein RecX n=1 Tax=Bacillus gaemokensis TaxID=574375 RepID=A0A073KIX4_9BACI|nr:recombination regulator RecX [Bacillus gaemokensis]KEK22293.1 recombinase RecX [Bacillus gaemokensis]KYG25952.1 recombinase RecX [Bacillus gaemokensis]
MAVITKVEVQKRTKERFNIYIDRGQGEEYGFSVNQVVLIKYGLQKGLEIDEVELGNILYNEEVQKAYLQAISYLSYQMRTKQEVAEYLQKKETGQAIISEVVSKLLHDRYINDKEYAISYVRTHSNVNQKGPTVIRRELLGKGVQEVIITHSLQEYSKEKQIENAFAIVEKKKKSYQKHSFLQMKQKLEEMLVRKGYLRDVIQICLEELKDEKDHSQQLEALIHHGNKYHEKYKKHDGWMYENKMKQALYRKGFSIDEIETFLQMKCEEG